MQDDTQTQKADSVTAEVRATDEDILQHHDKGAVMRRARVELRIVRRLLSDLRNAQYLLSIDDGEELHWVTNEDNALKYLFNLDEARINAKRDGEKESFVYLVFGNDGYDVICDYGMSLEPVMAPINEWITEQEESGI